MWRPSGPSASRRRHKHATLLAHLFGRTRRHASWVLNLKTIKLVDEDDASWRVRDARDNSTFRVAKNGLGKGLRDAIVQHFAEGGEVLESKEPKETEKSKDTPLRDFVAGPRGSAVRGLLDPAIDATGSAISQGASTLGDALSSPEHPLVRAGRLAVMGPQAEAMQIANNLVNGPPPQAAVPEPAGPAQSATTAPVTSALPPAPAPSPAPPPMSPGKSPSTGFGGGGVGGYLRDMASAEKDAMAAENRRADLAGKVAQDTLRLQQEAEAARQVTAAEWKQKLADNQARADALQQDLATGKIDPGRWWKSRDLGGKIAASIAIVLGGISQGFSGRPSAALAAIDNAIQQDIDSQKADIGKKENLLSHYVQQGHDLQAAAKLAKADQMDAYAGQMQMMANKYGGEEAAINAQKAIASIKGDSAKLRQGAMQQGFDNQLKLEHLRLQQEAARAKEGAHSALVAPGWARGQVPIKDEEAGKFRAALAAQRDIESAATELKSLVQKHGTKMMPGEVKSKMGSLVSKLILKKKNLEQLGAISGTDMSLIEGEVPDPRSWVPEAAANNLVKLDQLIANGRGTIDSAANAMGLERVQQATPQGLVVR